ncbi:MAG: hypothetical protein O7G86_08235, partial [Gammaproteobacteria bacterium]|nr:hypothetical protein [Gammaproteobacteria bacterium]
MIASLHATAPTLTALEGNQLGTFLDSNSQHIHNGGYLLAGFSLHAGILRQEHERDKLERLCRYT